MTTLRIKALAKAKGITMQDIADKIGINRVNLSNSLNGNPTLKRLEQVADCLGVDVSELFENSNRNSISGYLEYKKDIYKITSIVDVERFMLVVRENEGDILINL